MKEQRKTLISYRKEIEVLTLSMDVPVYIGERSNLLPRYEDVLLRLFNNQRDNKEILRIFNYYDSNVIGIEINLTEYTNSSNKEETIEHLKDWFRSGVDIKDEDIKVKISKGYIYEVPEYDNSVNSFEGDNVIKNYIKWED